MHLQQTYDAVVVGAGPAGSSFAKTAARAGMQVLVLDKKKEIGSPVRCGEGITSHWERRLDLPLRGGAIAQKINGLKVFAPNGRSLKLTTPKTTGYVLERKIFDKYLAIEAARAGAHFLPKTLATELVKEKNAITGIKAVHDGEEIEFRAPLIVSAEGMEAKIARQAGFPTTASLYDIDVCFEYEMANVECEPLIEIYFSNYYAARGYCWVFPKAKDVANVGIGVGGGTGLNPKERLEKFIRDRPERFKRAEIIEVKAGIISVGAPIPELVKDNFMVIGTSAHQVDPIHGGGMALAIKAAQIAAEVAAHAVEKKDFSKKTLYEYERKWRAEEEEKLAKRLKLRKVMERFSDDDLNHIFASIDEKDLEKILAGDLKPVVKKVLLKRPSLLKAVSALM